MRGSWRRSLAAGAALLPAALLTCWFFGHTWHEPVTFGYRDAGNYYYPLFHWQARQWGAGRVPLWNELDGNGIPVVAEATSSVFYPGKLLFALPAPFWWRMNAYVALHVLLCAVNAYYAARWWRVSRSGGGLAAVAYAFGGAVLFQYSNVVFLVSAAWLPLGLAAADHLWKKPGWRAAAVLGVVLALCTLGGDPQSAYHLALLALLRGLFRETGSRRPGQARRWRGAAFLLAAGGLGFCLAAVQILPTAIWMERSTRRMHAQARNVYEVAASGQWSAVASLFELPAADSHHRHVYQYSVGPWRWPELLWPNVSGRSFPVNRRWLAMIPAEGRTWTPSLYLGLMPLLLGVSGLRWRGAPARQRWLAAGTLLAAGAGLGWYGLGWLWQEMYAAAWPGAAGPNLNPAVGGLYWWMATLLPGYIYFRYPAKLWVVAALGLSLLAGMQWDRIIGRHPQRLAGPLCGLVLLTLVALLGAVILRPQWLAMAAEVPPHPLYGPLDAAGAGQDLLGGMIHMLLVAAALLPLLLIKARRWRVMLLLSVTALELAAANGWMVQTVPVAKWQTPVRISQAGGETPAQSRLGKPPLELPSDWRLSSSDQRLAEIVAWEHQRLVPKHHVLEEVPLLNTTATLVAADYRLALPYFTTAGQARELLTEDGQALTVYAVPRAWLTTQLRIVPPLASDHDMAERTRQVFASSIEPGELSREAVLETAEPLAPLPAGGAAGTVRIVADTGNCLSIDADLNRRALLVVNDYHYPGWQAWVERRGRAPEPMRVYRANRVMRGVLLDAGQQRVNFVYRPVEIYAGGAISVIAWLALLASCYLRR